MLLVQNTEYNYPQTYFQANIWLLQIRVCWKQYASIVKFHGHIVQKTAVTGYIGTVFDTYQSIFDRWGNKGNQHSLDNNMPIRLRRS